MGRQSLVQSLPAMEVRAAERTGRESPAGANLEGGQLEAGGDAGGGAGGPQTISVQTTLPGAGRGGAETWRSATIRRWNTLIPTTDNPGNGGRGYAAGAGVLAGHITAIRAYKTSKGW